MVSFSHFPKTEKQRCPGLSREIRTQCTENKEINTPNRLVSAFKNPEWQPACPSPGSVPSPVCPPHFKPRLPEPSCSTTTRVHGVRSRCAGSHLQPQQPQAGWGWAGLRWKGADSLALLGSLALGPRTGWAKGKAAGSQGLPWPSLVGTVTGRTRGCDREHYVGKRAMGPGGHSPSLGQPPQPFWVVCPFILRGVFPQQPIFSGHAWGVATPQHESGEVQLM